ncbi:hypothetical protein PHAMO_270030 [Magnetospirillum molischianum DSM 120]|uniref:Uncharacterized protein n=1 Tax=Magnetospirillum molischianum DSM 120 TaxID=1150626 RepID=H8FS51_MAGML|nr:hypothetical protein PHAMO_270030 [Magnetospirillum molischianum DSM 120]
MMHPSLAERCWPFTTIETLPLIEPDVTAPMQLVARAPSPPVVLVVMSPVLTVMLTSPWIDGDAPLALSCCAIAGSAVRDSIRTAARQCFARSLLPIKRQNIIFHHY